MTMTTVLHQLLDLGVNFVKGTSVIQRVVAVIMLLQSGGIGWAIFNEPEIDVQDVVVETVEQRLDDVQGPIGLSGKDGVDGAQGLPGSQGERGIQGLQGIRGDIGPMGLQGETGLQGPRGPAGHNGVDGQPGEKGDRGSIGRNGPAGSQGDRGERGLQGIQGPRGDTGSVQVYRVTRSNADGQYQRTIIIRCEEEDMSIAGGLINPLDLSKMHSFPHGKNAWKVTLRDVMPADVFTAYTVCVPLR
jgi:hypothetical protein